MQVMFLILWFFKLVKYFTIILFIVFVIWFSLALTNRITILRICGELPNGLLVARSALFSFQNRRMLSDVVLKLSDGTVLVKSKIIQFYFSETSTYGMAEPRDYSSKPFAFAYRPDLGFTLRENDPEKYDLITQEAGPLIKAYSGHEDLGYASL